jgi:hypothetical protein
VASDEIVLVTRHLSLDKIVLFSAHVLGGKGQERNVARAFDGYREHALVPGARADLAARFDLAALGHIAAQLIGLLKVNAFDFGFAKGAHARGAHKSSAALSLSFSTSAAAFAGRTALRFPAGR